jgi:hypothetical protein
MPQLHRCVTKSSIKGNMIDFSSEALLAGASDGIDLHTT